MKKFLVIISIVSLFISCGDTAKKKDKETDVVENATEKPQLALVDFDAKAGDYLDEEIQITGIVDHVCKHGGKKLLLVNDEADVHVESDTRFDDALVGDELVINGIVIEFRVDEAYLLQKEEDHIQNHKEGTDSKDVYDQKMEQLQFYRDSMAAAKSDHISYYSLDYLSHKVVKEGEGEGEEDDHDEEDHEEEENDKEAEHNEKE